MMTKRGESSYTLRIAGRDYTLTSTDSADHVRRVGVYVDRKIAETGAGALMNREASAVVAALAIADELMNAQDDNTRLRRELMQARQELQAIKNDQ